jgi:hypothetical protein
MDPIQALALEIQRTHRMDASEAFHFARQLEAIKAAAYDVKYPELKARTFIPVDNSADPGAETITYRQYDQVGIAKPAGNYAGDSPRVDVFGKEFTQKVNGWRDSYGYSTQDIRRSRFAGTDIDMKRAQAARRAMEEALDVFAASGNTALAVTGLTNNTNIPLVVLPNLGAWSGLTPTQILDNLNTLEASIVTTTNESIIPDTLILDTFSYAWIARTSVGTDNQMTILKSYLANSPHIKNVDSWHRLNTAGAGSIRRIVCYKRDPEILQLNVPMEFMQHPPQMRGLEFVVECEARFGGLELHYPKGVAHADIAL